MAEASTFNIIYQAVTFIDALFSIGVTLFGVYLYYKNRKSIKGFFKLLTNYSLQNTISELHEKLSKLSMYTVDTKSEAPRKEVFCILHEIKGQIEGNRFLKDQFVDDFEELEDYFDNTKKITDADKRRIATRLREKLKTLNLEIYNDSVGKDDE
jgi:hypothetical protein